MGEDQLGVIIVMRKGHIARDCPLLRHPWCSHCRNNTHATEDFLELIAKWEDCARK
jgi:hypothetical protein